MSRRQARKIIFQTLYRDEFHSAPQNLGEKRLNIPGGEALSGEDRQFARRAIKAVQERKEEIDKNIQKHSKNWKKERISLVDLNIMRLAVFEILFCPDIPDKAALNEALELAKLFGGESSPAFVNGILDQILKSEKQTFDKAKKSP